MRRIVRTYVTGQPSAVVPRLLRVVNESGCIDEDTALGYAGSTLDAHERTRVEAHLDRCVACRRLVSVLARDDRTGEDRERAEHAPLHVEAATIGRFHVLDVVGAGGMGVVYAAYDPELDRKVAIKVLRPEARVVAEGRDGGLLVEGKAMARVMHPNVVSVHDVGVHGRSSFIAMEFVDGTSFRRWLEAAPRDAAEILTVIAGAGRGLAAAHAAGLVHRDFKPDNVLVTRDGRAKVTDFGLARASFADGEEAAAREISGTPGYMSPEQCAGDALDARSDQYSFAVTLFEALTGTRTFEPVTRETPLRFPARAKDLPGTVRRALARALSRDKDARFASMEAMLVELLPARGLRQSRALVGAIGLVALVVLVAGGVHRSLTARARACAEAGDRTRTVWNDASRSDVRRRFEASSRALARDARPVVERSLDEFAAALATEERATCDATHVRREQSEETYALRTSCLERRRTELGALVALLAQADDTVIENAVSAVDKLTPLDACRATAALVVQPLPPLDVTTRLEVERIRVRLAEAKVLLDAGRHRTGVELVDAVAKDAERVDYPPLRAEVLYLQAALRDQLSDESGAEELLYRAAEQAEVSRHDEAAARAKTLLVWVVGYRQARHEVGHALERGARAAVMRAGGRADLEATLENNVGTLLWAEGRYALAGERFARARTLWERSPGSNRPLVADALNNEGLALWNQGRLEGALAKHEEALALRTRLLGSDHPSVASSLNNLGLVAQDLARFEDARKYHLQAIRIQTGAYGEEHPLVASAWNNLGLAELGLGEDEAALGALLRAFAIRKATRATTHPDIGNSLLNLAVAHLALRHRQQARDNLAEAYAHQERNLGPNHPSLVDVLLVDARLLQLEGRFVDAADRARRAQTLARSVLGESHPSVAAARVEEGAALLARGRSEEAAACFREVVMLSDTLRDSLVVGRAALGLAEALSTRATRPELAALIERARGRLRAAGARGLEPLRHLEELEARR